MEFTLLTNEQVFGSSKLNIFKDRNPGAAVSDFCILLGSFVSSLKIDGDSSLSGRTGYYWLKSSDGTGDALAVDENGDSCCLYCGKSSGAARPALLYSAIQSISPSCVRGADGLLEFEYGEYPQTAVLPGLAGTLESAYINGMLKKTGKTYTTDSRKYDEYSEGFLAQEHIEYEYNGKKYVRVKANSYFDGKEFQLSNGEKYKDGYYVWVEVEPVKWIKHELDNVMIAKKCLFSGVRFYKDRGGYDGDFSATEISWFMKNHFSNDVIAAIKASINSDDYIDKRKTKLQKLNPDTTSFEERRRMTDTEMIHNWIESGQSVLLRGPSGIGKTERLKTLYPDLIYIKLTNNMFPEKVVGSMNLQTRQSIPPDFAKQTLLSCSTDEERKLISENIQNLYDLADKIYERSKNSPKKIVILLDELLNVKPAVQSLVYTLVLNKLVETGKGLKLPANTVVVATGNQKKYSSVAEDLAEPLEKRFDHILDMEPKVGEWLSEYAIPNKIHPAVIGYIYSKYIQAGNKEDIKSINYFYEEPEVGEQNLDKNGCNGRTNDPRGWVSISNTLYAFEKDLLAGKFIGRDVESLLQLSLETKLRTEWAREFYMFYNIPALSVNDVLSGNYNQADLPVDINERLACVTSLLLATENEVAVCRNFIRKYCDPEYLRFYDICWVGDSQNRMQKLSEIEEMSRLEYDENVVIEGMGRTI